MNDNSNNHPSEFETPIFPGHETSMQCIDEMIDATPDIESEYALLMTRDLFSAAPDLLHATTQAFQELRKLLDSANLQKCDDVSVTLAAVSLHLKDAINKATPARPQTAV